MSAIVGAGNQVNRTGVEAQAASGLGGALADRWSWFLLWSGNVAHWWARNHENSARSLWETGLTPVVELRRRLASDGFCYIEAGIGLHLLSHPHIDERQLSTAFPASWWGPA